MSDLQAEILAVGTELLLGDIANTNAQYLSRELAGLGIPVYSHAVVGDNRERLRAALSQAFSKANLVIAVGGLGPTDDDITKEVAASFFSREMVRDEPAWQAIKRRFAHTSLPENVHRNALVPEGAQTLPNHHGSACGVWLEGDDKDNKRVLLLLPGPPHELEPMFERYAAKLLRELTAREAAKRGEVELTFVSRTLKFIGIGESTIETHLRDMFQAQTNPTLALYAKVWECHLRITAAADCEAAARELIEPAAREIYARLREYIYGEDSQDLAGLTVEALLNAAPASLTLAVAESCTGGLITAALVGVAGVSVVLREGLVTYSNEAKIARLGVPPELIAMHGAVSAECAAAMAEGAARTSGADIGLSTTGIAGPGGGTADKPVGTVHIGLAVRRGAGTTYTPAADSSPTTPAIFPEFTTRTLSLLLPGERDTIRQRASMNALDFLRKAFLK